MNKLTGTVVHIESNGQLSLVDVAVVGHCLTAILMEAPGAAAYLHVGAAVDVMCKPTEVSLAKNLTGQLSLRNRLRSVVVHLERGALLTAVTLESEGMRLQSVITSRAAEALALQVGDQVEALIKSNEIVLGAVCS